MDQLKILYQKVDAFFDDIQKRHGPHMQCQSGCSRCCLVELSVFKLEADHIRGWFSTLTAQEKKELRRRWQSPVQTGTNFHGETVLACPFLRNDRCTIYAARPLICRSQGLPLKFRLEAEDAVDACPLNFNETELELKDCLDLDKVNQVLAHLELYHSGANMPRVKLTDLLTELC